jgi:hypothetical protein
MAPRLADQLQTVPPKVMDQTKLRLVDALMWMSAEWDVTVDELLDNLDDRKGCRYDPPEVWRWVEEHDAKVSR